LTARLAAPLASSRRDSRSSAWDAAMGGTGERSHVGSARGVGLSVARLAAVAAPFEYGSGA
jgi:hypothetical protein